ncbi:hypothetical protein JKP88DRAFT_132171, partial [Tribonema minus]
ASDPASSDFLGTSCAVYGQYMIAGAWNKTVSSQISAGAAYVYVRSDTTMTGTWSFSVKLTASTPTSNECFGGYVAISGDTVVVGTSFTGIAKIYVWYRSTGATWTQQGPLTASDGSSGDSFGSSVAIDGDYIVAGARLWDRKTPSAMTDCGCAYVFVRSGSTWSQQAQLIASDVDVLGYSCAVDGQYMIAGAYNKTVGVASAGAAYIYVRPDMTATGTWSFTTKLTATTPTINEQFGNTVAISGDTVVVGTMYSSGIAKVYVWYRSTGTTWVQQGPLTASDGSSGDRFGYSVAIDGNYIVAGAYVWSRKTPSAITNCGTAYVFMRSGSTWAQQAQLFASDLMASAYFGLSVAVSGSSIIIGAYSWSSTTPAVVFCGCAYLYTSQLIASDPQANASFGTSVAISGSYAIVGALQWDQTLPSITNCGCAYVFYYNGSTWTQQAQLLTATTPTASEYFGQSVAISGDTIVVGTLLSGIRKAYVWYRSTGMTWVQQGPLTASDGSSGDSFGDTVAVNDNFIVVGAPNWSRKTPSAIAGCGAAYVFIRSGSTWSQQAQLVTSDPAPSVHMGASVSISGLSIVAGASMWSNVSPAVSQCGCAYVFTRSGTTWSQTAQIIASDPQASALFGTSVSISGSYAIVGAPQWDQTLPSITNCGCAYVFYWDGSTWAQQAQLVSGNPATSDFYGGSVCIRGSYALVGAYNKSSGAGSSYLFVRNSTQWLKSRVIVASDAAASDHDPAASQFFGFSVACDGQYQIVGAYGVNASAGAAYVYTRSTLTGTWVFATKLVSPSPAAGYKFGESVAISGATVVV